LGGLRERASYTLYPTTLYWIANAQDLHRGNPGTAGPALSWIGDLERELLAKGARLARKPKGDPAS
jgi:hypothetical protein